MTDPSGDIGTFEELAMPLFGRLFNFACWLAQNRATAEELTQETYMKALKGFASFEQGTNFRAWIYRILRNTFLTSQTGLKAHLSFDSEEDGLPEPASAHTPESLLLAKAAQQTLYRAIEELPLPFREIILLSDMEEMRYQEISATLGIPIGTVMSRLSRARREMRNILAAKMQGGEQ